MKIEGIELYQLRLPLAEPFIISGGAMHERESLVVRLVDPDGAEGWGECPPFGLPFYSEETLASARDLLERVLIPRLSGREFETPQAVDAELSRGVRGNPFARAGLETAAWDLVASSHRSSLGSLLGQALGVTPGTAVPCGVALGIPPDRSIDTLRLRVLDALDAGYRRVKIKIMPGWDTSPVRAVAAVLSGTGIPLTVDANGAYPWPDGLETLRALDDVGLLYIEQPLAPEELLGHVTLCRELATPICVDETLKSATMARQIVELNGPSIWNIKVHRVGGLTEACRIWRIAREHGITLWAGTMPESGIGSQAPLAMAALPGFDLPSDLEPSSRWYGRNHDVIKLVMSREGAMTVPRVSIGKLLDRRRFALSAQRCELRAES
ncbi:MAG TPA: o-succinylbenzoate synthase [Gemmatimonadales bacterium]|nr:o-succinylbenzoate synthase [Gemmatimonadales bacterium]